MTSPTRWSLISILLASAFSPSWADSPFLQLKQDIPLTGGVSRFDQQAFDPQTGMLYIAHAGAGQIILFNTRKNTVFTTLPNFPEVTGLLVVPELHRLYASVAQRHQVAVIDLQSLKVLAKVPAGHLPDGMAYVPELHQLFVSDELGGEVTVIDVLKNKRVDSIKLGGQAGNTRYDSSSRLIFTPVQTKNELDAIDPQTRKIIARYPIYSGKHPHGLWIDTNSHLAFLGCDKDSKLVVFDLQSRLETAVSDVGKDPDVLTFDSQQGYLYVASEAGKASVFRVRDRKIKKVGDFEVGNKAHTVEVNPQTHELYFPLTVDKKPVLRVMKPNL